MLSKETLSAKTQAYCNFGGCSLQKSEPILESPNICSLIKYNMTSSWCCSTVYRSNQFIHRTSNTAKVTQPWCKISLKKLKHFLHQYMHRNHILVISVKTICCLQIKWLKQVQLMNFQQGNIFRITLSDIKRKKMFCKTKCLKILCQKKIVTIKFNNVFYLTEYWQILLCV